MIKLNVDCLYLIVSELSQNHKSLHSCILVNREWCRLVVPMLWMKHTWYSCLNYEAKKKLYNIMLSFLSSTSKQLLLDNNIKIPLSILSKPPLFNYISFCNFPDYSHVENIMKITFENEFDKWEENQKNLLKQEIYKLFVSQCKNIKKLLLKTSQPLFSFPGASICFSQLYSLYINLKFVNSDTLYKAKQICKNLNELVIFISQCNRLISLIDAQRNLQCVTIKFSDDEFDFDSKELGKALAKKSDTINDLDLDSIRIIPPSFLISFVNLKSISINSCYYRKEYIKEEIELQQYLAISEFKKLQKLYVRTHLSCFKELAMLIEKTEGNILSVCISSENIAKDAGVLIKAISNHCPKIKYLTISITPKDFIYVKLLLNCKYLTSLDLCGEKNFEDEDNNNNNIGDELLNILTKYSPKTLTKISINKYWKYSIDALERFFESIRGRTLSNFKIYPNVEDVTEDYKAVVKRYIDEGVIKKTNFWLKY